MEDIIYFELDNWCAGENYPDAEPFLTWFQDDLTIPFMDDEWCKKNKLCVTGCWIDMSVCFCIFAARSWVEENCPDLLTDKHCGLNRVYPDFICRPEEDGEVYGRMSGLHFRKHCSENYGVYMDDTFGYE